MYEYSKSPRLGNKKYLFHDYVNIFFHQQDETLVVFRDIRPATPHHYLVVPKTHIQDPKILNNSHLGLGTWTILNRS